MMDGCSLQSRISVKHLLSILLHSVVGVRADSSTHFGGSGEEMTGGSRETRRQLGRAPRDWDLQIPFSRQERVRVTRGFTFV